MPQVNPTTPARRQREPSPHTPGDNKRQSLRLKAGQQALAGLTLGSRPVSASDNPEVDLRGETLPLQPWVRHCMEISDRPTTLPITHDPNLSDKVMYLQMAFKQRPLRDGGGKPSLGRLAPSTRPLSKAAALGQDLCPHVTPSRRTCWRISGRSWRQGQADQRKANPSSWTSCTLGDEHSGPQPPVSLGPGTRGPTTIHGPTSPGIWPLKKELKGEGPEFQELPHLTGRGNYPSADHFSELIRTHSWRRSAWAW